MQLISKFIPDNHVGKAIDLEQSVAVSAPTGLSVYDTCYKKLMRPFLWKTFAGAGSAAFSIIENGQTVFRDLKAGDYLRIDIPGPGTTTGDGYDWVKVEQVRDGIVTDAIKSTGLTLRASKNPLDTDSATAHFFTSDATSTFILALYNDSVNISYHGRNETPNTSNGSVMDDVRNKLVSTGALLGLSELQWSALLKGILNQ